MSKLELERRLRDVQALARMVKTKTKSAYNALDELRRLNARLENELDELATAITDTLEGGNDDRTDERRPAEGRRARAAA